MIGGQHKCPFARDGNNDQACPSYASSLRPGCNLTGRWQNCRAPSPNSETAFGTYAREKKATHLLQGQSSSFGNAVTRVARHMVAGGDLAFGSYTAIDELFEQQAKEPARAKREALLHAIQRIAYERVMFAPIWQVAQLNGVRTRIDQPDAGLIDYLPYSSPYEDLRLKP